MSHGALLLRIPREQAMDIIEQFLAIRETRSAFPAHASFPWTNNNYSIGEPFALLCMAQLFPIRILALDLVEVITEFSNIKTKWNFEERFSSQDYMIMIHGMLKLFRHSHNARAGLLSHVLGNQRLFHQLMNTMATKLKEFNNQDLNHNFGEILYFIKHRNPEEWNSCISHRLPEVLPAFGGFQPFTFGAQQQETIQLDTTFLERLILLTRTVFANQERRLYECDVFIEFL